MIAIFRLFGLMYHVFLCTYFSPCYYTLTAIISSANLFRYSIHNLVKPLPYLLHDRAYFYEMLHLRSFTIRICMCLVVALYRYHYALLTLTHLILTIALLYYRHCLAIFSSFLHIFPSANLLRHFIICPISSNHCATTLTLT